MISRLEQTTPKKELPVEWTDNLKELLEEAYGDYCEKNESEFNVFAYTYPNELMVSVGVVKKNNPISIPTTFQISVDLNDKLSRASDYKKLLNTITDKTGLFFDHFTSTEDWYDYNGLWQKEEFQGYELYIKTTRENIALSLQAEELLAGLEV
jgi:hypothetical protein